MRYNISRGIDIFIKLKRVIIGLHLHDFTIIEAIKIRIYMSSKNTQSSSVTNY